MNSLNNEINQGKSSKTQYFFLYSSSMVRKEVSRNVFIKVDGKIISLNNVKYKIIGGCTKGVSKAVRRFKAESVFDTLFGAVDGLKILLNALNKISELKNAGDKYLNKQTLLTLANILLSVKSLSDHPSVTSFIKIVIELFTLRELTFEKESLDGLLMAGLSMFLPGKINELIKRASTFTNVKFLDDIGLYHSLVVWLSDLFSCVYDFVKDKLPAQVVSVFDSFTNKINVTKHHLVLDKGKKLVEQYRQNPKIMSDVLFRHSVSEFLTTAESDPDFFSWARRHAGVGHIFEAVLRMGKVVKAYGEMSRVEPTCFVFEGPPGTLKSYTMLPLIKSLKMPAYSHVVKSVDDGKDFYDTYNNEPIFYMDDVGQQGISQWRTIINMVSPVKLPLDCADAKLKDTKFFNSELLFLTTNAFSNLHGLTKSDCISDIKALWRRGNVFDFSQAKAKDGSLTGVIAFKHFDLSTSSFHNCFPTDVYSFFKQRNIDVSPTFVIKPDTTRVDLLVWMKKIVQAYIFLKKQFHQSTELTEAEEQLLDFDLTAEMQTNDDEEEYHEALVTFPYPQQESNERSTPPPPLHVINCRPDRTVLISGITRQTEMWAVRQPHTDSYLLEIHAEEQARFVFSDIRAPFLDMSLRSIWMLIKEYTLYIRDSFWTSFQKIVAWFLDPQGGLRLTIYISIYVLILAYLYIFSIFYPTTLESESDVISFADKEIHSGVLYVQKNIKHCEIYLDSKDKEVVTTKAIVSGRKIILPSHAVAAETVYIKLFAKGDKRNVQVDLEKVNVVYRNNEEDVCIVSLPDSFPAPFKSLKSHIKSDKTAVKYWVGDDKILDYGKICVPYKGSVTYYTSVKGLSRKTQIPITIPEDSRILYTERGNGLCGSAVVDEFGFLQGMHVAGQEKISTGCARLWSAEIKSVIEFHLNENLNLLPYEVSTKEVEGSFVKLESTLNSSVPSKTNFGASPLYGIFPVTRSPANLQHSGKCTVKDVAKKSFIECNPVSIEEMAYARKVCASILVPFDSLDEFSIVKGTQLLAGLNKDSSNGYGCSKEKSDYIDFVNGKFTDSFMIDLSNFEQSANAGDVDWQKLVWVETLKDELRGLEKCGEPRSFRVGTIFNQVLTKKYFGRMVEHIVKNRDENQIMIGCNPFKDWDKMYSALISSHGVFAGDVKKWDGKMSPQVQREVQELLISLMPPESRRIGNLLIESTFRSIVNIQDDLILTTHSMASGSFLTAILNSFVHRFYTAMWFYRNWVINFKKPPTIYDFSNSVIDFLYGDDSVNAIKNKDILHTHNAISMRNFYQSLGMDLTTSHKGEITEPFDRIEDITFLKRRFVYHNTIGRVMCPLELNVLQSGLSWVDYSKDINQVMYDKVHNYQREIYLHSDWVHLLSDFEHRLSSFGIPFTKLSEQYLLQLYTDHVDSLKTFYQFSYF